MNGNEPIMPLIGVDKSKDLFPHNTNGLTKREYFAGLAMANDTWEGDASEDAIQQRAKFWIIKADALIAELDKTEKP